nr:PREDICTED: uncharacterized protein LOC107076158 isoform X2 [Lepisosteus oculatus]
MSLDSSLLIDGVLTWDSGICRCSQSSTPDQHVEKHQFICVNALSVSSRQAAEEPRGFSILACGPAVTTTQLLQEDLGASGRGRVEEAVGRPGSSGTGGQGMGMLGNGTRQPGLERAPPDLQLEDKGLCLTGGDGTPSAPQGTRRQAGECRPGESLLHNLHNLTSERGALEVLNRYMMKYGYGFINSKTVLLETLVIEAVGALFTSSTSNRNSSIISSSTSNTGSIIFSESTRVISGSVIFSWRSRIRSSSVVNFSSSS